MSAALLMAYRYLIRVYLCVSVADSCRLSLFQ
jgi:hypothetical protein